MKHPFVRGISARKEGKGARQHRRGPINTGLRYIAGCASTHILAPTRSALRVRRALFTNSHVSQKCRAYAVKSGFTPPEGNRYLLLISQMIAWRPHRCQWILVTPPIHSSTPCARGWEDSAGEARVLTRHSSWVFWQRALEG